MKVFLNIVIGLETTYLGFLEPLVEARKVFTVLFSVVDFSDQEEYSCESKEKVYLRKL